MKIQHRVAAVLIVSVLIGGLGVVAPAPVGAVGVRYLDPVFDVADITVEPDLVYGRAVNEDGDLQDLVLDLYRPDPDVLIDRPAFVWAHGGGFCGGSRKDEPWALDLARRGYVVVSISYRLRDGCESQAAIRDAQHDMQAAVRWLRANADTYDIDPARIGAGGYSAGAVMAIETAQSSHDTGASGVPGYSSWICFAFSLAGGTLPDVDPRDSPLALFHGTKDTRVPFFLAQAVHEAYQAQGLDSWLFSYPTGHSLPNDYPDEIRAELLPLAREHLVEGSCAEPPPAAGGGYHRLDVPARGADTRTGAGGWGSGPIGAREIRTTNLVQQGVIPAGAAGVVMNVTAVEPTERTHITVFPSGGLVPAVSSLNVDAGATRANVVMTATPGGAVSVRNSSGSVHVVIDVLGWIDGGAGTGDRYVPVTPKRLVDTRRGIGIPGPLGPKDSKPFVVTTGSGVPVAARSVVGNLTAVGPSQGTHLTSYAFGFPRPSTSTLNAPAGAIVPNLAVSPVGLFDGVAVFNNSGSTDVLFDVSGAFVSVMGIAVASQSGRFRPAPPTRLLDTRDGLNTALGRFGAGETRSLDVRGLGGLPPEGVAAVVVNVVGVGPTELTHLTVAPGGSPVPRISSLNLPAGQTAANAVVVPVGPDGTIQLRNEAGEVDVVVDVAGWFMA